jgi:hypothetical protein
MHLNAGGVAAVDQRPSRWRNGRSVSPETAGRRGRGPQCWPSNMGAEGEDFCKGLARGDSVSGCLGARNGKLLRAWQSLWAIKQRRATHPLRPIKLGTALSLSLMAIPNPCGLASDADGPGFHLGIKPLHGANRLGATRWRWCGGNRHVSDMVKVPGFRTFLSCPSTTQTNGAKHNARYDYPNF